jgi:uncharacterized membrane protein
MEKEDRPNIKPLITRTDKAVEIIAITALAALWLFVFLVYSKLPEIIPTHFNGSGKADGFGDKESIFLGPGICTVMFLGMSFLQMKVRHFNFITEITPENALKQYTFALRMVRMLKLSIVMVFAMIEFHTYKASLGMNSESGKYLILATLALVYIPILYFLIQSSKNS